MRRTPLSELYASYLAACAIRRALSWSPAASGGNRVIPGARLYEREILHAHLDFLPSAFRAHGLPLALYVDYHSFFFTSTPDAFTQLGSALRFYEITLRYAPTPQAKG